MDHILEEEQRPGSRVPKRFWKQVGLEFTDKKEAGEVEGEGNEVREVTAD